MTIRSDDPLRRVTLNLYEADVIWLIKTYGHGWTERIRQHIHDEVVRRKFYGKPLRTVGDLE